MATLMYPVGLEPTRYELDSIIYLTIKNEQEYCFYKVLSFK